MPSSSDAATADHDLRARREAVVRRHIAAENSRDLEATVASFARPRYDVVPIGAVSEGEAAVRALVAGLLDAFPDFRFEPSVIHHAAAAVIVEGRMTGTQRGEWAGIPPRNAAMDLRVACVFDFDADRLLNETVYFDFATLHRQLTGA
jgi:steroid delta-isomerase-like uncharacterized protein